MYYCLLPVPGGLPSLVHHVYLLEIQVVQYRPRFRLHIR